MRYYAHAWTVESCHRTADVSSTHESTEQDESASSTAARADAHAPAAMMTQRSDDSARQPSDNSRGAWTVDAQPNRYASQATDWRQIDHLPSAWHKREHKKTILLTDIEVVCGPCNIARGSSRPGSKRWNEWLENENPKERESNDPGTTGTKK